MNALRQDPRRHCRAEDRRPTVRRLSAALLCLLLPVMLLVPACEENPQAPVFANPFDPDVASSANPFNLRAVYSDGKVTLIWTPIAGFGITTYHVYRVRQDMLYPLAQLNAQTVTMTHVIQDPVPNFVNAYLVQGVDEYGLGVASSDIAPVQVAVPPILKLAGGGAHVRTRYPDLVVRAARGDFVQVDTTAAFATAIEAPITADSTAAVPAFDLGPRLSTATRCTLFARAGFELGGGQEPIWSGHDRLVLSISFSPTIRRPDSTVTVAAPLTDLVVSNQAAGVDSMRFAASAEALAAVPWQAGAALVAGQPLLDTPLPQTVHAQFLSEFGFTHTTTLNLTADDLAGAAFALDLPSNRVSPTPTIGVHCSAVATEMRLSQYPDFHDAPWQPYAGSAEITLAGEPGPYQIFAWFRNHWFTSAIMTEQVILAGAGPSVAFAHPTAGQAIVGGTRIELAGSASTFDGDHPVTAVQVKLSPEGAWQAAAGTEHWSAFWDVPLVEADTPHALGARAIVAGAWADTATAWIEVTITPPVRRPGG